MVPRCATSILIAARTRGVRLKLTLVTVGAPLVGAHHFPHPETDTIDAERFAVRARRLPQAERIISSPTPSAIACAKAAGRSDVAVEPALHDRDCGAWAGLPIHAIAEQEPDLFAGWLLDETVAPPGGESVAALVERVGRWVAGAEELAGRTLAFTHPAVVRACLAAVLASPAAWFIFEIAHATRTDLSRRGGRWHIELANAPM